MALEQVPFIMQALGYYPSQYEIENMLNELKYSNVETSSGLVESITFAELLKRKCAKYEKESSKPIPPGDPHNFPSPHL